MEEHQKHPRVLSGTATYPSEVLTCPSTNKVLTTPTTFTKTEYEQIVNAVIALYDGKSAEDGKNFAACILRLAGHDFMDFRDNNGVLSGGADGCVNFNDADNMGLEACLTASGINSVYQSFCSEVSLADFIVISAEALMTRTATDFNSGNPFAAGTLGQKFRDRFRPGRTTLETCPNNVGLMPDAEQGCDHLSSIFIAHIYKQCVGYQTFTNNDNDRRRDRDEPQTQTLVDESNAWRFTAAISGAHTLGQARIANSGFNGHWSDAANQGKFNNDYYRSLLLKGWGPEFEINGNANKNQWKRIDQDVESNGHHEIMLNSDMCLAYKSRRSDGFLRAQRNFDCCGWTELDVLFDRNVMNVGDAFCGITIGQNQRDRGQRRNCCADQTSDDGDCDDEDDPQGPAIQAVYDFAASEANFITGYTQAWWLATENGFLPATFSCLPTGTGAFEEDKASSLMTNMLLYSSLSLLLLFQY